MDDLLNLPTEVQRASDIAMKSIRTNTDEGYTTWLKAAGYKSILPSSSGIIAATEFNMIYGDDVQLLPAGTCRDMIKRKYWKYFNW